LGQPQLRLHLTGCGGGTSPVMLSQLELAQVGGILPLQLANCAAHQLKLLDVYATLSFRCSMHWLIMYPLYIQVKHCYVASQKAMSV